MSLTTIQEIEKGNLLEFPKRTLISDEEFEEMKYLLQLTCEVNRRWEMNLATIVTRLQALCRGTTPLLILIGLF